MLVPLERYETYRQRDAWKLYHLINCLEKLSLIDYASYVERNIELDVNICVVTIWENQ